MSTHHLTLSLLAMACGLLPWGLATAADATPANAFDPAARTLRSPAPPVVRDQALAWLESLPLDDAQRTAAAALWKDLPEELSGSQLLDLLAATFAAADPQAAQLVEFCAGPRSSFKLPDFAWLADDKLPPLMRNNLRLLLGRWLAREKLYDDALVWLEGLEPTDVVDPAALLFFQGAGHHWLLHKEAGTKSLRRLVDEVDGSPKRYISLAELMLADLEALQDESLDHIARRMDDVERRLDLGHAGPKVRTVEDGIIASLDKMIEKMEDEAKKKQAGGGGGGGSIRSSSPAQDSTPMGGKGPGETDRKNIGSEAGWGDLPPKERQEALQQIGKDFPSHYRDVIEQYFRKLAGDEPNE
ncbi:MAG: hypothetical protein AB7O62_17630 [Pirellulales bacterium]